MTVRELLDLFIDSDIQDVIIFDLEGGQEIYSGYASELPDEYAEREIESIDNINKDCDGFITLNV